MQLKNYTGINLKSKFLFFLGVISLFFYTTNSYAQCVVDAGSKDTTICQGQKFIRTATITGANPTIKWYKLGSSSITLSTTATIDIRLNVARKDSFIVKVTSGGTECYDTVAVTVNPSPSISIGADLTLCQNATKSITATFSPSNGTINWYSLGSTTSLGTGATYTLSTSTPGTFNYVAKIDSANTCSDFDTVRVVVNSSPTAGFSSSINCGRTVSFNNTSTAGAGATITKWEWDFGVSGTSNDVSTQQNPTYRYPRTPGTYNVSLTVTNSNGCKTTIVNSVTTSASPIAELISDQGQTDISGNTYFFLCSSPATFTFYNSSKNFNSSSVYEIKWGDNSPNETYNQTTFPAPASTTIQHTYNVAGTYNLTFYMKNGSCIDSANYKIFLGTAPAGAINRDLSTKLCEGQEDLTFKIFNTSQNTAGTIYELTFSDGSPIQTFIHPISDPLPVPHTFNVSSCGKSSSNGATTVNNSYGAYLTIKNPCGVSPSSVVGVFVASKPKAGFEITPDTLICVNQTITITDNSDAGNDVDVLSATCVPGKSVWQINPSAPATNYTVVSGSLGTKISNNPANWTSGTKVVDVKFNNSGLYTVNQFVANNNYLSCGIDDSVKTICVNPIPTAAFTLSPDNGCSTLQVTATGSTNTPTCGQNTFNWSVSYQPTAGCTPNNSDWSFINGTGPNSQNPQFAFVSPGVYTISLQTIAPKGLCSSAVVSKTVTVRGLPNVSLSGIPAVLCEKVGINPNATATCYIDNTSTYAWTFPNGTPATSSQLNPGSVSFNSSGSKNISLSVTNVCGTTTRNATININPLPPITGTLSICVNATTQLTSTAAPANTNPWVSSAPTVATVSNTGLVTGVFAGSAIITYTDINGCKNTVTITVNALPTISGTLSVCVGATTQLTGSATAATTNPWTSSNTAVATINNSGLVTGVAQGTTIITYTNSNGCQKTETVTVNPLPTITGALSVCVGATTQLTGSATAATTTPWVSSNTAVATVNSTGLVTGVAQGTTIITYTNNNGCKKTETVTVNPLPTITGTLSVCIGATTQLTGSATAAATNPWTSSNTAVATINNSGLVTGVAQGTTIIIYTNSNGCQKTETVTVNPLPTITGTLSVCVGASTQLTGSASPNTTNPWLSSNNAIATVSTTGLVTGVAAGTVTISYRNTNNCQNAVTITVNPIPTVNDPADQTVCNDNPTSAIIFSGNNVSGVVYNWTNNTPSIGLAGSGSGNIPSFIAVNNGTSAVTATITVTPVANNCTGTSQTFTITVNPAPAVTFSSPNQNICSGQTSQLVNLSSQTSNVNFSWTAVQPSGITGVTTSGTSTIPAQTLTNSTNSAITVSYIATATTSGGTACPGSQFTYQITVHPKPVLSASNQIICSGSTTSILLTTATTPSTAVSYAWTPSVNANISGATASSGATIAQNLSNSALTPQDITYTITPTYTSGSLTCTGNTQNVVVTVNPLPNVAQPSNIILCNNTTTGNINFSTTVTGTTYAWTNSNTSIGLSSASGTGNISAFNGINSGNAPVSTTINVVPNFTNTSGPTCSGQGKSFTITVNPRPTVNPVNDITLCHNVTSTPVSFTSAIANTFFEWANNNTAIGLGASGTGSIPVFTATNTGTAPVSATITVTPKYINSAAATPVCSGTPITLTITVNPRPTVTATPNTQAICSGASTSISLTSNISSGVTFSWTPSTNTNISGATASNGTTISQTLINLSNSAQTITYTITPTYTNNLIGCIGDVTTAVITINPAPSVVQPVDVTYCNNAATAAIVFSGAVSGTNFSWTNSNTAIGLATTNGTGNISSFTATNTGTTPISSTITVTPSLASATACSGTARTFTITVNPTPSATATPATATICSGTAPSIALTNNITGTIGASTFTWSPSANVNITGAIASSGSPIAQVLTNTSLIPQSLNYTITPTYTNNSVSCNGSTTTATVTVNPVPQVNQPVNLVVCNNATTGDISFSGSVTGTSYTWVNNTPTIGLAANGTGNITSFTATNSTNAPIIATITVTPRYLLSGTNFCTGPTKTFTITVNPTPTVTKPANITICNGQTSGAIALNGTVTGTTFPWTNDQASIGLAASGTGNITAFNGINTGTAPVTATITFTPTYTNAGVTCTGTNQSFTITVNPAPSVTFTPAPQTICSGQSTAEVTLGSTTSNVTYTWSSNAPLSVTGARPSGSTGTIPVQTLVNNSITPQTVVYTATAATSGATACPGGSSTYNIVVNPKPVIPAQSLTICSEDVFTLTLSNNPTTTILPANTTYTWTVAANSNVTGQSDETTGTLTISQTLTNLSNTQQEVVYTIIPTSGAAGACPGSPFELKVKVDPRPKIPNQTATVCSGLSLTVPIPANNPSTVILPANTTYRWTFVDNANVTGESAQATGVSSITQTLINNTDQPQDVVYTVTPITGNCQGLPFTVTITVNPAPYIPNQTAVTCSDVPFEVIPANGVPNASTVVPAGTKYTWTVVDNPLVSGDVNQSAPQTSISQTLTNNSNTNQTVVYTVTPVSGASGSCTGPTFTVTVTLNTKPVIPNQNISVCSGNAFSVPLVNNPPAVILPAGTTYTWTFVDNPDVNGASNQTTPQNSISQILVNTTNAVQTVIYTVTPLIGNCSGNPFTLTVTVNPAPVIPNQTAVICSREPFTIAPANAPPLTIVPGATTYTWTVATNNDVTGQSNQTTGVSSISQTLTNNTNVVQTVVYTVTPLFANCTGAAFTVTVTVNPKPVIPAQSLTICSEDVFTLTLTNNPTTTILPANTTYTWTVAVNSSVTGQSNQTTATSTISQTLTNLSNTQQEVVYTITPTSGAAGACPGSPFELKVKVDPRPKMTDLTATVCSGLPVTVTIPANNPPNVLLPANTTYTWTFTDNANVTGESAETVGVANITQTLINKTDQPQEVEYEVTPKTGNCVGSPFKVKITVNPAPYIPNQTAVTCSDVPFEVIPANGVPNASTVVPAGTKYTWTVVDNPLVSGEVNQSTPQTSISQTLTNNSNTNQTVVYTVTPVSGAAGGCVGPTFTVTVTLNTKPVIPNQNISVCSGNAFSVPLVNNPPAMILPAGTTYTWTVVDNPDVNGESDQTSSLATLSQTLTNTTNVPQVVIYNVTPGIGNCTGEQFTLTVTVNPAPIIPNQNTAICSGDVFTISPVNNPPSIIVPPNTTYTWTVIDNPNVTGDVSQSNAQISISQNLTNNTNQVQTVIYTVTPLFDNCPGKSFTVNVDVNPVPRIPSETINFCSGNVFVFNPTNNQPGVIVPANTTYEWTISNNPNLTGQFASTSPASEINQTLKNNSNTPQLITYTITPTSGEQGNCVGQPFTYTITVNPAPSFPTLYDTICSGSSFDSIPQNNPPAFLVPVGTTYTWSIPNMPSGAGPNANSGTSGGVASNGPQNQIFGTLINTAYNPLNVTYSVVPTSPNTSGAACAGAPFNYIVTVNPLPVINNNPLNQSICDSGFTTPVLFTSFTNNSTYSWREVGTTSITGQINSGVGDIPSMQLFNAGVKQDSVVYSVVTTANKCSGPETIYKIYVNPDAKASVTYDKDFECWPFDLKTQGGLLNNSPTTASDRYEWYVNDTLIGRDRDFPGYTIVNPDDSAVVKLIAFSQYGCKKDSVSHLFRTKKKPKAEFTADPTIGCGPLSVNFTNTSPKDITDNTFTYKWFFGVTGQTFDGYQPPNPGTIYPSNPTFADTIYKAFLVVENVCYSDTAKVDIQVSAKPKAVFAPDKTQGCSPLTVTFANRSLGIGNTYEWDFGDGSPRVPSPGGPVTHVFTTGVQTIFKVKLFATNKCGTDVVEYDLLVTPNPIKLGVFVNGSELNGCAPHTVRFNNNSTGATKFDWDFGDGSPTISTTNNTDVITHVYQQPGSYLAKIRATSNCSDTTALIRINVFATPTPDFTISIDSACLGEVVTFTNKSQGDFMRYIWDFGDGTPVSNVTNPTHKYAAPGTYNVKLTVYSVYTTGISCFADKTIQIKVVDKKPLPVDFTISALSGTCAPFKVDFENKYQPYKSLKWELDGVVISTANAGSYTFTKSGTYKLKLTIETAEGCFYSGEKTINLVTPEGTVTVNTGFNCDGTVLVQANAINTRFIIVDFGDGRPPVRTTNQAVTYTYTLPGSYDIKVSFESLSGCIYNVPGTYKVMVDKLNADFSFTTNEQCGQTKLVLTDKSSAFYGVGNIEWFVDGILVGSGSPFTFTATVSNTYVIRQKLIGKSGCSTEIERQVPIFVRDIPTAAIVFDNPLCTADSLSFRSVVQSKDPIQYYNWTFSSGTSSDKENVNVKITTPGTYNVTLIAGTSFGCYSSPVTRSFAVYPSPIVSALPESIKLCRGQSVNLRASGAISYVWSPTQGLNATNISNPVATPLVDTRYVVLGTNQYGCTASDSVVVSVIQPYTLVTKSDTAICIGQSVQLFASGAPSYKWTPPTFLNRDDIPNPIVNKPTSTIVYTVKGYDELNCFNQEQTVTVRVGQYPVVNLGPDVTLSTGTLFELKPQVTNGPIVKWEWTPPTDLTCTTCENPTAYIRKNITYKVVATNEYGCSGEDNINIKVFCENTQVYIPNAFTPGGGTGIKNEVFYVQGKGIMQVKTLRVFNRWGEMVFERTNIPANDPTNGWDGRIRGVIQGPDVYGYVVEVLCDDGTPFFYKGNVTLLK